MNIFYLDSDPQTCAKYHVDKHVCKMLVEYTQLLSTAHRLLDGYQENKLWKHPVDRYDSTFYKATHINHPCAKWVRESTDNYKWLYHLLFFLCKEYTHRYGKIHKCESSNLLYLINCVPVNIPTTNFTEPPKCMPDDCITDSTIKSYQQYYILHKNSFASWKNREIPFWFNMEKNAYIQI